jgi:hypothetical protein
MRGVRLLVAVGVSLAWAGCGDNGAGDASPDQPDLREPPRDGGLDLSGVDLTPPDLAGDLAMPDLAMPDLVGMDLLMTDLAMPDLAMPDLAMPDLAMPDLAMPDLAMPDLAMPDLAMPDLAMPLPDLLSPLPDLVPPPPDLVPPPPDLTGAVADLTFVLPDGAPMPLDSGMCNTLINSGPAVPETNVPLTLPDPTGGTIALGLYELTTWEVFTGVGGATGPTGNTRKTAFYFEPTMYFKVTADNGQSDENDSRTWTTMDVTTLVSNQYCPNIDFLTSFYSVTGNLLILQAGNVRYTFTHR